MLSFSEQTVHITGTRWILASTQGCMFGYAILSNILKNDTCESRNLAPRIILVKLHHKRTTAHPPHYGWLIVELGTLVTRQFTMDNILLRDNHPAVYTG